MKRKTLPAMPTKPQLPFNWASVNKKILPQQIAPIIVDDRDSG
jgi:hypothetical protein